MGCAVLQVVIFQKVAGAMVIVMRELKIYRQINLQQQLLGGECVVFVFSYVFKNVDVNSALMLKANT